MLEALYTILACGLVGYLAVVVICWIDNDEFKSVYGELQKYYAQASRTSKNPRTVCLAREYEILLSIPFYRPIKRIRHLPNRICQD